MGARSNAWKEAFLTYAEDSFNIKALIYNVKYNDCDDSEK